MLRHGEGGFTPASSGVMPHGNEEAQVYPERVHVPGWSVGAADAFVLIRSSLVPTHLHPSCRPSLHHWVACQPTSCFILHGFRRSLSHASQWVLPLLPRFVVWLLCAPVFASPGQMPLPVATSLLLGVCLCLLTSYVFDGSSLPSKWPQRGSSWDSGEAP